MRENRLSQEEFVIKAIKELRTGNYKGIHSVYSGFNAAFKKYFNNANPVEVTTRMAKEGKIVIRPAKGGVVLYLADDVPEMTRAEAALKKMGLL